MRLDDQVAELRRLLAGEPPFEGADPVGPRVVQPGGPELLAGALGPRSMRRAARWADGVTGFSVSGAQREIENTNRLADAAWAEAGRGTPRKVNGCFFALGIDDAQARLTAFAERYLAFMGPELATAMAAEVADATPDAVDAVLEGARAAGCDELVLVPASADLRCLDAVTDVVAAFAAQH